MKNLKKTKAVAAVLSVLMIFAVMTATCVVSFAADETAVLAGGNSDILESYKSALAMFAPTVEISDGIDETSVNKAKYTWDISEEQDESVIAWMTEDETTGDYNMYIASDKSIVANADMSGFFAGAASVDGLEHIDTSNVTTMRNLFKGVGNIPFADINGWNFENVTDMSGMFYSCGNEEFNLSGWNVKNVVDTSDMFRSCESVKTINLGGWNVEELTTADRMFFRCSSLTEINFDGWNTNNLISADHIFAFCSKIESLDLTGWNTSKMTNMGATENPVNGTHQTATESFYGGMFYHCTALREIKGIESFDTSNVTNMNQMFYNCKKLESLNIGSWDTSAVTDMSAMFYGCASLKELDLNEWDTSAVREMNKTRKIDSGSTYYCSSETGMFANCLTLKTLKLSSWNISAVKCLGYMFYNCTSLEELDLSDWNTTEVTRTVCMFKGASSLKAIYIGENWSIRSVTVGSEMFADCEKLTGGGMTYDKRKISSDFAVADGYMTYRAIESVGGATNTVYRIFLDKDEERDITALADPELAYAAVYSSNNPSVASVSDDGNITAVDYGTARIIATVDELNTVTVDVTVRDSASSSSSSDSSSSASSASGGSVSSRPVSGGSSSSNTSTSGTGTNLNFFEQLIQAIKDFFASLFGIF